MFKIHIKSRHLCPRLSEDRHRPTWKMSHYVEQLYGREMGEKKKWTSSCAVEICTTEETKVVRDKLMWVACLLSSTMVTSDFRLLPRTMTESRPYSKQ